MTIKKAIFTTLKIALFIVCFTTVERFCHKQTEGFMLHKIKSDLTFDPRWEHPAISEQEKQDVLNRLDQPFYYLKSGGQCYAFISKDGTTILKFFKMHHMREIKWLSKINFPAFMDPKQLKFLKHRERRFQHIFGSCKIAYEDLKAETGILYCHLNKTDDLNKQVTIYDKIGIRHTLDLDQIEFVVQKKATLVFEKFHQVMKEQNTQVAHACIDSLLKLFITRYQKGIADNDPVVRKNFGFIDDRAVEIDLGSYFKNESLQDPATYTSVLHQEMQDFDKWLQEHYPSLSPYLEERINAIRQESSS